MRFDKANLSDDRITIRVTAAERQTIKDYCKEKGLTVSKFIRDLVLKKINE